MIFNKPISNLTLSSALRSENSCLKRKSLAFYGAMFSLTVLLGSVRTAEACSCDTSDQVRPSSEDTNVPTNTRIWISDSSCTSWNLYDGENIVVTNEATLSLSAEYSTLKTIVLTPEQELTIGKTYSIGCESSWTSFTVTAEADTVASEIPSLVEIDWEEDKNAENSDDGLSTYDSCGEYGYSKFTMDTIDALIAVDFNGQSTFDAATLSGSVSDLFIDSSFVYLGDPACEPANWDFEDGSVNVRFGGFDLAGNFSGWSESTTVEEVEPQEEDSNTSTDPEAETEEVDSGSNTNVDGCSMGTVTHGANSFAYVLFALVSLMARRRR